MDAWIGWIKFKLQNGLSIQTHTASADRASAIRASAARVSAIKASAVRVSAARASASTARADRATAHHAPHAEGSADVWIRGWDEQEKNESNQTNQF